MGRSTGPSVGRRQGPEGRRTKGKACSCTHTQTHAINSSEEHRGVPTMYESYVRLGHVNGRSRRRRSIYVSVPLSRCAHRLRERLGALTNYGRLDDDGDDDARAREKVVGCCQEHSTTPDEEDETSTRSYALLHVCRSMNTSATADRRRAKWRIRIARSSLKEYARVVFNSRARVTLSLRCRSRTRMRRTTARYSLPDGKRSAVIEFFIRPMSPSPKAPIPLLLSKACSIRASREGYRAMTTTTTRRCCDNFVVFLHLNLHKWHNSRHPTRHFGYVGRARDYLNLFTVASSSSSLLHVDRPVRRRAIDNDRTAATVCLHAPVPFTESCVPPRERLASKHEGEVNYFSRLIHDASHDKVTLTCTNNAGKVTDDALSRKAPVYKELSRAFVYENNGYTWDTRATGWEHETTWRARPRVTGWRMRALTHTTADSRRRAGGARPWPVRGSSTTERASRLERGEAKATSRVSRPATTDQSATAVPLASERYSMIDHMLATWCISLIRTTSGG